MLLPKCCKYCANSRFRLEPCKEGVATRNAANTLQTKTRDSNAHQGEEKQDVNVNGCDYSDWCSKLKFVGAEHDQICVWQINFVFGVAKMKVSLSGLSEM